MPVGSAGARSRSQNPRLASSGSSGSLSATRTPIRSTPASTGPSLVLSELAASRMYARLSPDPSTATRTCTSPSVSGPSDLPIGMRIETPRPVDSGFGSAGSAGAAVAPPGGGSGAGAVAGDPAGPIDGT